MRNSILFFYFILFFDLELGLGDITVTVTTVIWVHDTEKVIEGSEQIRLYSITITIY